MGAAVSAPRPARRQGVPALDLARVAAAVLVVCIHTSPLGSYTDAGDFFLCRVLARLAVPFFLMVTGYFLAQKGWRSTAKTAKRLCGLYALCVALYLPLNLYGGGFAGAAELLQKLLVDGTFYHLWYFPGTVLGLGVAYCMVQKLGQTGALAAAAALYLIGLGGDSYYGLAARVPALNAFYDGVLGFSAYTRNGLFYAPLFLLLGAAARPQRTRRGRCALAGGLALAFAAMVQEAFLLRGLGVQRHDSMYLALPLCMVFLFSLLLGANAGRSRAMRELSLWVYMLHPWCIVLVRGGARVLGLQQLLVQNSLGHFAAVLALSLGMSLGISAAAAQALRRAKGRKAPEAPPAAGPAARAWREIDLAALRHNAALLQKALAPGCRLMAVVKADAYGHGAVPVARCLQEQGVRGFAVACAAEGAALRKAGVRGEILVLGYTPPEQAALLRRWGLTQTVADATHGRALAARAARGLGRFRPISVQLALDTGMHRLGIPAQDLAAIRQMYRLPGLRVRGVFSHLCVSDSLAPADAQYTQRQLAAFYRALHTLRAGGLNPGETHIQASYGILNLAPQPCAWARAGIALYGVASEDAPTARLPAWQALRPVLSLKARVALVRELAAGESAGYGLAFTADRPTRLATVAIGYADGLPRALAAQGGEVLLHGVRCPMVGRMCMDQLLVDVTDAPQVTPGDVATLIGADGHEAIPAEAVAAQCGTITNELLARLGPRLGLVLTGG